MKKNKICSKCDSNKVVEIENSIGFKKNGNGFINIPISAFKTVETTRYICCECGYIEQWVSNKDDLKLIYDTYK
ncbi:MAG: hypothetical protein ACRCX2_01050 [Paraclostridium sp.]